MSALSDLLNEHIPAGMSSRELERQCKGAVSRQTFDNYRAGRHGRTPSDDVLRVFHELLKVPLRDLRLAAAQPVGEPSLWKPPQEAHLMDRRQRRAVTELIRSFVAAPRIASAEAPVTDIATKRVDDRDEVPPPQTSLPDAARTAPPGYTPGQADQGDAGGEEPQVDSLGANSDADDSPA